jgi:DNA invertase Pin-like site-specific DNA recombinase
MISVAEPDLCDDDPTRTLIRQILGSFFEYERKMIVSKLADARRRTKSKIGRCEGVKTYGTLPGEAEVLVRIRELQERHNSPSVVAEHLNVLEIPTRYGKRWHAGTVSKILSRKGA